MKVESLSEYIAFCVGTYAITRVMVLAVVRVARVFTRVEEAHKRIDEHKKEIEEYFTKIDDRIGDIQKELKEMYKLLLAKTAG